MAAPFGGTAPAGCRQTGQPVRRKSCHRGEREHLVWSKLGDTRAEANRFKGALLKAAERFDHSTRRKRMGGELGWSGLRVLKALCDIVDNATGRLEPSIATIAEKARMGVRTVVRALKRLQDAGFLDWLRRTEPTDNDGAGPQVHQVTNAYWFALRGRAAGLVRLILGRAPPDARSREEVQGIVAAARRHRLEAMRRDRPGISAADVLSDEVKASLRKLKELRRASAEMAKNPGDRG